MSALGENFKDYFQKLSFFRSKIVIALIICGIVFLVALPFIMLFFLQLNMIVNMYFTKAQVNYFDVWLLKGAVLSGIFLCCVLGIATVILTRVLVLFTQGSRINLKNIVLNRTFVISLMISVPFGCISGLFLSMSIALSQYFSGSILDVYLLQYSSPSAMTTSIVLAIAGNYSVFVGILFIQYLQVGLNLMISKIKSHRVLLIYGGIGVIICTTLIPMFSLINVATPALSISLWIIGIFLIFGGLLKERIQGKNLVALLFCVFIVVSIVGLSYQLQWQANYREWEWSQTSVSINLTSWAIGGDVFERKNFTELSGVSQEEALSRVRQWDKDSTNRILSTLVQNSWMSITEADITNLPSEAYAREYWIIPTEVSYLRQTDWKNTHCIYTHSEEIYL
ncbi:MAG: hypothetical protein QXL15_01040, partial [Candidatus Korarchaeota archaeon]